MTNSVIRVLLLVSACIGLLASLAVGIAIVTGVPDAIEMRVILLVLILTSFVIPMLCAVYIEVKSRVGDTTLAEDA